MSKRNHLNEKFKDVTNVGHSACRTKKRSNKENVSQKKSSHRSRLKTIADNNLLRYFNQTKRFNYFSFKKFPPVVKERFEFPPTLMSSKKILKESWDLNQPVFEESSSSENLDVMFKEAMDTLDSNSDESMILESLDSVFEKSFTIKIIEPLLDDNLIPVDSVFEEFDVSVDGKRLVDLSPSEQSAFFNTFFQKLENDAGKGCKYGGYDMRGALRTVTGYTVSAIVSLYSSFPTHCKISLFDCRSENEYSNGHVKYSVFLPDDTRVEEVYKDLCSEHQTSPRKFYIFIFYCEFSSKRGPSRMKKFMSLCNSNQIFLDNIYLMDGGYNRFFDFFKGFCQPMGYVGT